jgi:hypothetical protein
VGNSDRAAERDDGRRAHLVKTTDLPPHEPNALLGGGAGEKGMFVDLQQVPTTLSERTMEPAQPAVPVTAAERPGSDSSASPE